MKSRLVPLVLALLLLPLSLSAQNGTWTAVASSGDIDETSLGLFAVQGPLLFHAPGAVGNVVARYNVTNTFGGGVSDFPGWNTLELGYFDAAAGTQVTATLFQVNPCTGASVIVCVVTSVDNAAPACATCMFGGGAFNFGNFLYFVEVTVQRAAAAQNVSARTLRIF